MSDDGKGKYKTVLYTTGQKAELAGQKKEAGNDRHFNFFLRVSSSKNQQKHTSNLKSVLRFVGFLWLPLLRVNEMYN